MEEEQGGLSPEERMLLGRGDIPDPTPGESYAESIDKASRNDPDKLLEAIALEQATEIPAEIIEEDPEEARRRAWVKKQGLGLDDDTPKTTEWLSDPQNATVAKDDYSNLREIERISRQQEAYSGMEFQDLGNIVEAWGVGLAKMGPQLLYGLMSNPDDPGIQAQRMMMEQAIERGDQDLIDELEASKADFDERMAGMKEYIEEAGEHQAKLTPQGDFVAEVIHGGGTMALDLMPGMAISALTKGRVNPTLPFLTTKVFAESQFEALAEGRGFHEATRYAGGQAALEWVFEKIPTKQLERIVGDLGGKGDVRGTLKRWFATEALTEQGAELTQTIHSYIYDLDEEMANASTWGERLEIQSRRQAVVLFSTIIGGGGVSTAVHGLDRLVGRKQRANREAMKAAFSRTTSEQSQDGLDKLFSLAQSSATNERDASYLEDHINNVVPDGVIYISADAVDAMEDVPDYIAAQLDGSRADVVVPLSRFVRDFASDGDKLAEVRRYIKTAAHLQTLEDLEANTDSDYIKRVVAEAAKAQDTKQEADRIYDEVVEQLIATGRQSPLTSRQSAQLIPAVITTQYEELRKMGATNKDGSEITVAQLYEDIGLKIVGPETEVTSAAPTEEAPTGFLNQAEKREYDEAVSKGLPVDQISRLQRAVDQGYNVDQVYYHGTMSRPFSTFDAEDFGAWFSTDPAVASGYAETERRTDLDLGAPQVMPVYLKSENTFNLGEYDLNDTVTVQEFIDGVNRLNGTSLTAEDFGMGAQDSNRVWELVGQNDLGTTAIRNLGFDALQGTEGGKGVMSILNAQNIRSVNAAFDPDFSDTPRVLSQQNFSNINITETVADEAGNIVEVTQSAQVLWEEQQQRHTALENLRGCVNG